MINYSHSKKLLEESTKKIDSIEESTHRRDAYLRALRENHADITHQFPGQTTFMTVDVADEILKWCVTQSASDISFAPNKPVFMRKFGEWHRITQRHLSTHEISNLLDRFSRQPSASSMAKSGQDVDFPYEVTLERGKKARFRANATGCRDNWSSGIELVMRTITEHPPSLESMGLPKHICDAMKPIYGLVLVSGPVGSGKSTLLNAIIGDIAINDRKHILTYESPIEFDIMGIPNSKSLVIQSEIPTHLKSYREATRNSLRRAGDVIMVAESRDTETLSNMSRIAETGVAVYSTIHTNSAAEIISRAIGEFPESERHGMASSLIASLRVIFHQRLVKTADGKGRVALREWLVITDQIRKVLNKTPISDLTPVIDALVEQHGRPIMMDVTDKYKSGIISEADYESFVRLRESESSTVLTTPDNIQELLQDPLIHTNGGNPNG